jgi:hypothetical protein
MSQLGLLDKNFGIRECMPLSRAHASGRLAVLASMIIE